LHLYVLINSLNPFLQLHAWASQLKKDDAMVITKTNY